MTRHPATLVNDVHSRLNPTQVRGILAPASEAEAASIVQAAAAAGQSLALSGSRHAMGGQQFARGEWLVDTRGLNGIHSFDNERGLIEVGAGLQWPALIQACHAAQPGVTAPWTIAQKQTGADDFTLGGSVSANVHGRGLAMASLVSNVEALTLLDANGETRRCSRTQNPNLFRLAAGGYGLFGLITRVQLRLARRSRLRRLVTLCEASELPALFAERIAAGCHYGDFQFSVDERSPDFLRRGVLSCYQECEAGEAPGAATRSLSAEQWLHLLDLAHTDRAEAFTQYSRFYLSTHGQKYWSDTHQLGPYLPDYHRRLRPPSGPAQSLMISELYVPRPALPEFLAAAARWLRAGDVPAIYGTVRLIERDSETFLPWARQPYACVIFNLLTPHTRSGVEATAHAFRRLIDIALDFNGSFYLTYHRHATRRHVETCYPQFEEFLERKRELDPEGRFQSDWYRHMAPQGSMASGRRHLRRTAKAHPSRATAAPARSSAPAAR